MRILVTGGAGFIGSNLCESLLREGHEVVALDNLITGSESNLETCFSFDSFAFVRENTENTPDLEVEAVFHLASPASPVGYGMHPIETLLANSLGSHRVLELCRRQGAKFLLASTSEVYGDPLEHPQRETYFGNVDPVGPRACYDEGKRFSEALTMSHMDQYGTDARIVRIFNCYGPRNSLDDGRMVPTFVRQALLGQPMPVFGDGSQTRSLCFVSDLVRGLEAAMFCPSTNGEIFNLGNPQEHTILEFAELIREIAGSDSDIVHVEGREGEIARRRPDVTKVSTALGWQPSVDVRDGLKATIAWAQGVLETAVS